MMKRKGITAIGIIAALLVSTGVFAETEEELKTIGTKEEGCYEILVTNETGRDISEIRIRLVDETQETEFSDNMLEEDDIFVPDEARMFYFKPEEDEEELPEFTEEDFAAADAADGTEEDQADENMLIPDYDLQITFGDDYTTVEVNSFPFEDADTVAIKAEDGVGFVVYTSLATEEEVNTKEYALAVLHEKQEAHAQAVAAAEAAAAQQANTNSGGGASTAAPAYTAPTYTAPVNTEPAPAAPAVTEPTNTEPAITEPSITEPTTTEPAYTEPVPVDPQPVEPAPVDPAPAEPAPAEPVPANPAPAEPISTEPGYTEPGGGDDTCIEDGLFYD